jgi:hypothetical protein
MLPHDSIYKLSYICIIYIHTYIYIYIYIYISIVIHVLYTYVSIVIYVLYTYGKLPGHSNKGVHTYTPRHTYTYDK